MNHDDPALPAPHIGRRRQLFEVAVFLFLLIPTLFLSLIGVSPRALSFPLVAGASMLTDLALTSLIAYFLWSSGEGMAAIGWRWRRARREVLLGALLFVPFFLVVGLAARLLEHLGLTAPPGPPAFLLPQGRTETLLALVFLTVVAVAEETIFRGYLLRRLGAVTGSTTAAVVLSTIIFAIGHGYEGSAGMATVGLMGILFALIYLWRGSLLAPMTLHFLQNFTGIILVPLLVSHGMLQ